jgi:hypothetical protein
MRWEAINQLATAASFSMGESAVLTTVGGLSFNVLSIVERDDAKVVPNEGSDGFFEIVDNAIGQFRSKIDMAMPHGAAWSVKTSVIGAEVQIGDEKFVVEYVLKRDSHHIKTLARRA